MTDARARLHDLAAEYAAAVDARDMPRLVALFEPDGTLTVPGPRPWVLEGHAALARLADGLAGFTRTFHFVGQATYRVDADTATGEVYCQAHHLSVTDPGGDPATDRAATDSVWFIRYHDAYRRTDDSWRFARRRIELLWTEDRPAVAPPDEPGS